MSAPWNSLLCRQSPLLRPGSALSRLHPARWHRRSCYEFFQRNLLTSQPQAALSKSFVSYLGILYISLRINRLHQLQLMRSLTQVNPFTDQAVGNSQQDRPEKNPHKAKGNNAAKYSHQHNDQRQIASPADQVRFEKVIYAAYHDKTPKQHEGSHSVILLQKQPENGGDPDQRRAHRDNA